MLGSLGGCYRGLVVDNHDPEGLSRLRVQVPQVLGNAITDWAWPSLPVAVGVTVPAEGDPVWVMFEAGDITRPVWIGIWRTYRPSGVPPDYNFGGVVTETTFGQAPSNGTALTLARSDHTHGSPVNPVPAHEAAGNPHPQYATDIDLVNHLGDANPHGQYATDADLAAHAAAADPHGQYATDTDLTTHVNHTDPHPNAVLGISEDLFWMTIGP